MAHRFEKGKPIYFLFKNGYTVQDSQLKPRYYLDRKKAEEYLPYGDEIVEYAPTIEAEPEKRGHWIFDPTWGTHRCSECGELGSPRWKRCPVCEAKMGKRRNNP